jgi:hypothetical protein
MNLRIALPPSLRLQAVAGLVLALGFTPVAQAFLFDFAGAKGSFDTTISIGGLYRVKDADRDLYGLSAGGLQRSVNADDGNLNYRSGMVSFLAKANHDLFLKYKNSGVFVRGFYFNDFVNSNGTRDCAPRSATRPARSSPKAPNYSMPTCISTRPSPACPPRSGLAGRC